jgi:hypothetical protein
LSFGEKAFIGLATDCRPRAMDLNTNFIFQEWTQKKSGLQNELARLGLELQSTILAKNRAEDDLADCIQKKLGNFIQKF